MQFIWTGHAQIRMQERGIAKEQVMSTVLNPDSLHGSKGSTAKKVARKKYGVKQLKVIYLEDQGKFVIITTAWVD